MRLAVALLLLASAARSYPARATSISVNGACEAGPCSSADVLDPGQHASSPFSFVYTFANSDRYQGTGTLSAAFNFPYNEITAANISLTYLGNATGSSSAHDTLGVNFLQSFNDGVSETNHSGFEYFAGDFSGAYSGASSVTGQAFTANNTAMTFFGPFTPPDPFSASAVNQPVSFMSITPLSFEDNISFGAGSGVGATIAVTNVPLAPVPEPATWLLLTSGLSLFGATRARRVAQAPPDAPS